MYFNRKAIKPKGDICQGLLAPRPPKGGVSRAKKYLHI